MSIEQIVLLQGRPEIAVTKANSPSCMTKLGHTLRELSSIITVARQVGSTAAPSLLIRHTAF